MTDAIKVGDRVRPRAEPHRQRQWWSDPKGYEVICLPGGVLHVVDGVGGWMALDQLNGGFEKVPAAPEGSGTRVMDKSSHHIAQTGDMMGRDRPAVRDEAVMFAGFNYPPGVVADAADTSASHSTREYRFHDFRLFVTWIEQNKLRHAVGDEKSAKAFGELLCRQVDEQQAFLRGIGG